MNEPSQPSSPTGHAERGETLSPVLHQNISALLKVRQREQERRSISDRIADTVTRFAGSIRFVWIHIVLVTVWIIINSVQALHIPPWDPFPYVMLAVITSIEAIFLSTFILITQNRMSKIADRRSEMDLQISLLTEHELTRVIQMLDSISKLLGAPRPPEKEMEQIKKDIDPQKVAQTIEQAEAARDQ